MNGDVLGGKRTLELTQWTPAGGSLNKNKAIYSSSEGGVGKMYVWSLDLFCIRRTPPLPETHLGDLADAKGPDLSLEVWYSGSWYSDVFLK